MSKEWLDYQTKLFNDLEEDVFHDGYHCDKCKDKGYIKYNDGENEWVSECTCYKPRIALKRLKAQGLDKLIDKCTFKAYERNLDFQKVVYDKATEYVQKDTNEWFAIFGMTGCGKSHICTAIVGYLVKKKGIDVNYICWNEFVKQLNGVNNTPQYDKIISEVKDCECLYIDDFLKPLGAESKPTQADLNKAFEILDHRVKADLRTIISGERTLNEIMDIDGAIGGRIYEMAKNYAINIGADKNKNYRTRNLVEV